MKKAYNIFAVLIAAAALTACDGYFDADLSDQPTMEEVFSKRPTATAIYLLTEK